MVRITQMPQHLKQHHNAMHTEKCASSVSEKRKCGGCLYFHKETIEG